MPVECHPFQRICLLTFHLLLLQEDMMYKQVETCLGNIQEQFPHSSPCFCRAALHVYIFCSRMYNSQRPTLVILTADTNKLSVLQGLRYEGQVIL